MGSATAVRSSCINLFDVFCVIPSLPFSINFSIFLSLYQQKVAIKTKGKSVNCARATIKQGECIRTIVRVQAEVKSYNSFNVI